MLGLKKKYRDLLQPAGESAHEIHVHLPLRREYVRDIWKLSELFKVAGDCRMNEHIERFLSDS